MKTVCRSKNRQADVLIIALRRSGTTALWKTLRQDRSYVCYDEPMNPMLRQVPATHRKGTWDEFNARHAADPSGWNETFAPIPRAEEVTEGLTARQATYLNYLRAEGPVVIDETRCTMKLSALSTVVPDAVLVHLYRHPVAFVSSHLIASQDSQRWRQALLRLAFFWRVFAFNNWGMEELWHPPTLDRTRAFLKREKVRVPQHTDPAMQKLMAFWLAAFRRIERDGRALYDGRFISLSFEDFCSEPQQYLKDLRTRAGASDFTYDLSALTAASSGYKALDARWAETARKVGFDGAEMNRFFPEARH